MKIRYCLPLFSLLYLNAYSQNNIPHVKAEKDALSLLADSIERAKFVKDLSIFLAFVDYGANNNPRVSKDILKDNEEPYVWLMGIGNRLKKEGFISKPQLLAVIPRNGKYFAKVAYEGITEKSDAYKVETIATLVAERKNGNFYFLDTFKENTNDWNKKRFKHVDFFYERTLDFSKAKFFAKANQALARKFGMDELNVRYFKFTNPEHLFKTLGFDYIPNMYFSNSGGLAEPWSNTLFAGNNSEIYIHELVHFYLREKYPKISRSFDEGYATYVGGSGEIPLADLKKLAKSHLTKNTQITLEKAVTDFSIRVEGNIPIAYILSGLVCHFVESKFGFEALNKIFNLSQEKDYFTCVNQATGMSKETTLELLQLAIDDNSSYKSQFHYK